MNHCCNILSFFLFLCVGCGSYSYFHALLGLEDLIWVMGAAEVQYPIRIHMVFTAVVRVWVMEVCPSLLTRNVIFLQCISGLIFPFPWLLGSFGGGDVAGMYSSSYGSDYMARGADVILTSSVGIRVCGC